MGEDHIEQWQDCVTDLDFYLNFLLHAILGRLREADTLMHMVSNNIRTVARQIAVQYPVARVPLYRGMLLDPEKTYAADPKLTFLSWSEDKDVARWFACPRSAVSEPLAATNAKLRGHLVELLETSDPPPRVLFHYSWTFLLEDICAMARAHPLMGDEAKRQIKWSLRTQREVVTEPIDGLSPKQTPDLASEELEALERKLSPPWIVAAEGIRR